jgi:hypothetical protein
MEDSIFSRDNSKKLGPVRAILAGCLVLALGCWILCGAAIGLVRGKIPRLSTHSRSLLVRAETPEYYWATVGVDVVLGATFGWGGLSLLRRSLRERRRQREIRTQLPPGFD